MFEIGEKIFYPMHGAGVIVDIQEKEILNQVEKFYVAKMPGEVKLMLPVKSAENLGLRPLVSEEEASGIISSLLDKSFFMPENWTERYNGNKEKLKTGDLHEIADIYKGLSIRNNKKNLSTTEKKMLTNAKQVLLSELSDVVGESFESLETKLEKHFNEMKLEDME
mgnify:FL=1